MQTATKTKNSHKETLNDQRRHKTTTKRYKMTTT